MWVAGSVSVRVRGKSVGGIMIAHREGCGEGHRACCARGEEGEGEHTPVLTSSRA